MVTDEIKVGTILRRVSKKNIDFNEIDDFDIHIEWLKGNKEFEIISFDNLDYMLKADSYTWQFTKEMINKYFKVKKYDPNNTNELQVGTIVTLPTIKSVGKQTYEYNNPAINRAISNMQPFLYIIATQKNRVLLNDHMPDNGKMTGDWYGYSDIISNNESSTDRLMQEKKVYYNDNYIVTKLKEKKQQNNDEYLLVMR